MSFTRESAAELAKKDLASRLKISVGEIAEQNITDKDFPDMSLGAATDDEMAAQMISSGWEIVLGADGKNYEYRADKYQLRLVDFDGRNHIIE